MDANTWNSYHIISNRARSICYATRQQQFRLKTEFTVNKLANQAENQMHVMNHLQVSLFETVNDFCDYYGGDKLSSFGKNSSACDKTQERPSYLNKYTCLLTSEEAGEGTFT